MVQKFIKNPVEIEAIQWSGNRNKMLVEAFVGKELKSELESETAYVAGKGAPIFSLLIDTKEGVMKAMPGDWIIKEPFPTGDRDFYPCKNEIFEKTYTLAPSTANIPKIDVNEMLFCAGFKQYECTNCQTKVTLKDNKEITVGFCNNCGHPLWNDDDSIKSK